MTRKHKSNYILFIPAVLLAAVTALFRVTKASELTEECILLLAAAALAAARFFLSAYVEQNNKEKHLLFIEFAVLIAVPLVLLMDGKTMPAYLADLFVYFLALPVYGRVLAAMRSRGVWGIGVCAFAVSFPMIPLLLGTRWYSDEVPFLLTAAGLLIGCAGMEWFSGNAVRDVLISVIASAAGCFVLGWTIRPVIWDPLQADGLAGIRFISSSIMFLMFAAGVMTLSGSRKEKQMLPVWIALLVPLVGCVESFLQRLGLFPRLSVSFPYLLGGYGAVGSMLWVCLSFQSFPLQQKVPDVEVSIHPALLEALERRAGRERAPQPGPGQRLSDASERLGDWLEFLKADDEDLFDLPYMKTWSLRLPEQRSCLLPFFCDVEEDGVFGIDELLDELRGKRRCTVHFFMGSVKEFIGFREYLEDLRGKAILVLECHPADQMQPALLRMRSGLYRLSAARRWIFLPQSNDGLRPGTVVVMICELPGAS